MKRVLLTTSITVAILMIVLCAAFIYLRQPTSTYEALENEITKVDTTSNTIRNGLTQTSSLMINDDYVTTYEKYVSNISTSIDEIDKSPVIANDSRLHKVYETHKNTLQAYVSSNKDLVESLKLYLAVISQCHKMISSLDAIHRNGIRITEKVFDTKSNECIDATNKSNTAPDKIFTDQFLSEYIVNMNKLINSYRLDFMTNSSIQLSTTSVNSAWNVVTTMNAKRFTITRSPDPTGALSDLRQVTSEQKSSFFR
ncbi:MAG: hypothetical protein WAW80_05100 [Candidatus Saccharimonadales bacterium]